MGLADKKPDSIVALQGRGGERYRPAISALLQGILPPGWQWVASSRDTVVAVTTAEPQVYYKEFLPRGPFEGIKAMLRGSRARRARRQVEVLRQAGLASPEVLCWGRGHRNEFLVTAGFAGSGFFQFLKHHFAGPLRPEQIHRKRQLLRQAGALIGRLHSKGLSHGDLRQDNLLVRETGQGFRFCFIDNERNRQWRRLPVRQILINLVQFAICSDHVLSRSDLLRLFSAYSQVYPRLDGDTRRRLIAEVIRRSRRRVLHYLVKQRMTAMLAIRSRQGSGFYDPASTLGRMIDKGCDLEEWFRRGDLYKDDEAIQVKALPAAGDRVVAKRFCGHGLAALVKVWCGLERPPRLWHLSHHFLALEVPIAAPQGYFLAGRGPWRRTSYFFSDHAGSKVDLLSLARQEPQTVNRLRAQGLFTTIAFYLARLHNNGYCHGDTKWANVMVEVASGELLFIDLDGAAALHRPWPRRMVKDISRFVVDMLEQGLPAVDIRQFVKEYSNMRCEQSAVVAARIIPHICKALRRHGRQDIDLQTVWPF